MKLLTKTLLSAALFAAVAAPASAMISGDIHGDVRSAAGANSNVNVFVDGTTVTIAGYVEDSYALQAVERAAHADGVDKVINNVFRTN